MQTTCISRYFVTIRFGGGNVHRRGGFVDRISDPIGRSSVVMPQDNDWALIHHTILRLRGSGLSSNKHTKSNVRERTHE
jgi:hypothetical protein